MPHVISLPSLCLICLWLNPLHADEVWTFDTPDAEKLSVHGRVSHTAGVLKGCVVLRGNSVLEAKRSQDFASAEPGFTLMAWVNPYLLSGKQQMIAAKNRYSMGDRKWSVMIDTDNRFRLYVYQGKWVTLDSSARVTPGHWYLIGVVMRPRKTELWVNGELAGTATLTQPVPNTRAPLTFGGVDDNGRQRQTLFGALDEIRLYYKPVSAQQMASAYVPVTSTHNVPETQPPVTLWTGASLPTTSQTTVLEGLNFHVIKRHEPEIDGYGFLHGVALAWHKGKLYASFGHNKGSENTFTEEGRYCVSSDGGSTWSKPRTIDAGIDEENLAVSHGVFLSRGETLWAFLGSFYGTRKRVHTRAYKLAEQSGRWEPQGTVIQDGFWPMNEPVKMTDGNWIMPGFIVGNHNPAAVAISNGDDLMSWKTMVISPDDTVRNMWGESAIFVDGAHVTNIARYGAKPLALAASSQDYGATWSASSQSNLPMAASKPCSGVLSNGQRYLIGSITADGRNRRSPLTIAMSKPGENTFSRIFVIRHALFENGPGESNTAAALSYPYATEHQGKLYVGYSNNGPRRANNNSAEMAVIPIEKLAAGATASTLPTE